MPKCGQFKLGAAWTGVKEPDKLPNGNLRFYDRRCRARIITGARVRGSIAKNSTFRVRRGNGYYGAKTTVVYQDHYRYFRNIGAPGSNLESWQTIFKQVMQEVAELTDEQRAPYKAMELSYRKSNMSKPGTYRALTWHNFYIAERLKELYPGY